MAAGVNTKIQIGVETTYGTGVTPTLELEAVNFNVNPVLSKIESNALVGKRMSNMISTGPYIIEGSFDIEVNPDNFGLICYLALGAEADPVEVEVGEVYTHKFTPLGTTGSLPSFTCVADKVVSEFEYAGCKIDSLALSLDPEGYMLASITFRGQQRDGGTCAALSLSTLSPYVYQGSEFKLGTAGVEAVNKIGDTISLSPSFANGLEDRRFRMDGNDYTAELRLGKAEFTAEVEMDYTTAVDIYREANFIDGAALSAQGYYKHSTAFYLTDYYEIKLNILYAYVMDMPVDVSGPESIPTTMSLKATEGTNGNVEIILQDARATKWSA